MTHKRENNIKFTGFASGISDKMVFDTELIKQDLLNHFHTRPGERLMQPEYGSIVWDLLFEVKSDFVLGEIERDSIRIIETDPRVGLEQIQIVESENGYEAHMLLQFVQSNKIEEFKVDFNNRLTNRN